MYECGPDLRDASGLRRDRDTTVVRTMTPLPKYFAVSNTRLGSLLLIACVRLARTGKSAPPSEPTRMTKTATTRSGRSADDVSAPHWGAGIVPPTSVAAAVVFAATWSTNT